MTKKIEISMPTEFWNEIDSFTSKEGMTINEFIFWALGEKIGEIRMGRGIKNLQQNHPKPDQNNSLKPYSPNQLLRAAEVAKCLGISKTAAYKLIQTKELTGVRFGKIVRVKYEDLEKFIVDKRQ